jgi:hypothetical protein
MQTNELVRFIGAAPHRVPSVVLYSDKQLRDLKAYCFNRASGSVWSFDKTFNLGSVYVTPSVYKNMSLTSRRTGDCPIFLGPVFLHGHSDLETYGVFFGHMATRLMDCSQTELTLGSDEELAIRKSMAMFFPRASTVVCSRHIKDNIGRKLDSVLGAKSPQRKLLYDAICRSNGLMGCNDVVTFDATVDTMRTSLLPQAPLEFRDYFEKKQVPLLRANVAVGFNTWTNNNCESMNHVLKQYVQWKTHQLPELINKIGELIIGQHIEADSAMVGRGEFVLKPTHAKHQLTIDTWKKMSDIQRQRASDACFRLPAVPSATSTDGSFTVPLTPGAGKKLNQTKRRRNAKTTTIKCQPASKRRNID